MAEKSSNKNLWIVLGIVLALVLGYIAYVFVIKEKPKDVEKADEPSSVEKIETSSKTDDKPSSSKKADDKPSSSEKTDDKPSSSKIIKIIPNDPIIDIKDIVSSSNIIQIKPPIPKPQIPKP